MASKVDNIKGSEKPVIRPQHPAKPSNPPMPKGKVENVKGSERSDGVVRK